MMISNSDESKGFLVQDIMRILLNFSLKLYSKSRYEETCKQILNIFEQRMEKEFQRGVEYGKQLQQIKSFTSSKAFTDETAV